ncbi:MAG: [FeFe] hydrogenase H-cluster radical SAM maturase HydG, partial [Bacteroidetes bacterium]|nr:[FeFe] hydrogenase H-cluster radical SAM maturase HydG [Bacteroidota bacterium]
IDPDELWDFINNTRPNRERIRDVIAKSLEKNRLTLEETAVLINATDSDMVEMIKDGARTLKERVYGNRIVLFAPLYVGNKCINNCAYCGFRTSNKEAVRITLSDQELVEEVESLEDTGQKRLILVYGEHPDYSPEYIAHTVRTVYQVKKGNGEIRRVNINAAPLGIDGFRVIKQAGIGTYQIFQETYHPGAYAKYHLGGVKRNFEYRLTALDRAQEAGIDDVGIGALFGLYDWRYEVMGLVRHANHFEAVYDVGPHTISFPRIQLASAMQMEHNFTVNDEDFTRLVAILRLAVPYTGLILTAREKPDVRREVLKYGVSQIDGGTKLELGGYHEAGKEPQQNLNKEQFFINDSRPLEEIIGELLENGYLPSFCTSCYRMGRTGEHFMEFSVPGFIKRYCSPNAILTLAEYLEDYASAETKVKGYEVLRKNIADLSHYQNVDELNNRVSQIKQGQRDLYF